MSASLVNSVNILYLVINMNYIVRRDNKLAASGHLASNVHFAKRLSRHFCNRSFDDY